MTKKAAQNDKKKLLEMTEKTVQNDKKNCSK